METVTDYQLIERYLRDPAAEKKRFWMSPAVFWFDWREYDGDIVRCVSESLPESARFAFELRDSPLPRGFDILLKRGKTTAAIPYAPDRMDRDTTLRALQAFLAPDWQLRCFVPFQRGRYPGLLPPLRSGVERAGSGLRLPDRGPALPAHWTEKPHLWIRLRKEPSGALSAPEGSFGFFCVTGSSAGFGPRR